MSEKISGAVAQAPDQKVRFGNFEIVNDSEGRPLALGKGTFGRTYQARHCYLDTIVALKIITERYAADAAVRQRFLIEARAVAKLSHPHVARLYDFGEMDGVLHYAMEYCGGGSLADYVGKHGPLGLRHLLEVAQQIAGALKCAHAAGFIHRDLKPSNIMLTADADPLFTKLIDFGLVQPSVPGATRSVSDDQSADGARFLGTPLFASPEQLREEPMDVRTDLFSFGVTLWYLALGAPPESGSSAAIAASRLGPESYSGRLPADMPPQLRDVISKLLEKDRNRRFSSASEVFAALNLCAGSLGFRRARDYTDPRAELSEWEDEEARAPAAPKPSQVKPIEVHQVNAELSSEFSIIARINEDFTGLNYVGAPANDHDAGVILHVLHPMLLEDAAAFNRLRVHLARLTTWESQEIVRPKSLNKYSDYTTVVLEKPTGADLMSILRTERTVQLMEIAPLLEQIADACDALNTAGLPGVQLTPARVYVEWDAEDGGARRLSKARPKLYPRFLAVSEAPELARINEPEDVSSTMTTDMLSDPSRADNMPEHFGTLVYRVVAGRNCPMAAALSSQAYVAIPGLSEHSNRLLSLVIAKQIASTSCGQILREILGAEGVVPRVPGHPSAGFTVGSGTGSTVSPITPPPVNRVTERPTVTPAPQWRPPAVTPPPIPAPPVVRQPVPVVPTPPPAPPAAAKPILPPVITAKAQPPPPPAVAPPFEKPEPVADKIPAVPKPEPPTVARPVADKMPGQSETLAPQVTEAKAPAPPQERAKPETTTPVTAPKAEPAPPKAEPVAGKIPTADQVSPPTPKPSPQIPEGKTAAPPAQTPKPAEKVIPPTAPKPEPASAKAPVPDQVVPTTQKPSPQIAESKTAAPPPVEKPKAPAKPAEKISKEVSAKPPPPPDAAPKIVTPETKRPAPVVVAKATPEKSVSASPSLPMAVSAVKTSTSIVQDTEKEPFRLETLWEDRRFRAGGIAIAALMLITTSYGVVRHFSTGAASAKTKVVTQPSVAPVSPPGTPVSSAPPVAVTSPSAGQLSPNAEPDREAELSAEREAAAAASKRKAEEARVAAQQQAPRTNEGPAGNKHRQPTGGEGTKSAAQHQSAGAPRAAAPPPAAPPKPPRSAPAKSNGQRPHQEFEGTRPGG